MLRDRRKKYPARPLFAVSFFRYSAISLSNKNLIDSRIFLKEATVNVKLALQKTDVP